MVSSQLGRSACASQDGGYCAGLKEGSVLTLPIAHYSDSDNSRCIERRPRVRKEGSGTIKENPNLLIILTQTLPPNYQFLLLASFSSKEQEAAQNRGGTRWSSLFSPSEIRNVGFPALAWLVKGDRMRLLLLLLCSLVSSRIFFLRLDASKPPSPPLNPASPDTCRLLNVNNPSKPDRGAWKAAPSQGVLRG